jgi:hypothetical protein
MVDDFDPLERLLTEAGDRGLDVRGWTNSTHNSRLGAANPNCVARTCFGDPLVFALCPAHPAVRAYVVGMSGDLAARGIASLTCETLGYLPFDHGWHHERSYVSLSAAARFVMGLCFCEHCTAAGRSEGVDVERLRRFCTDELELVLHGRPRVLGPDLPVRRDEIGALAGGEMGGFLAAREHVVTSLAGEVVAACGDVPVMFMDVSGGLRGAGSGMSAEVTPEPATARSWQEGTDLAALAATCHGVQMLGYSDDLEALGRDLDGYLAHVAPERLSVGLRPMAPDTGTAEQLEAKLRLLAGAGVRWVDFYHYAFIPLENLGWIARALRGAATAVS